MDNLDYTLVKLVVDQRQAEIRRAYGECHRAGGRPLSRILARAFRLTLALLGR